MYYPTSIDIYPLVNTEEIPFMPNLNTIHKTLLYTEGLAPAAQRHGTLLIMTSISKTRIHNFAENRTESVPKPHRQ